MAKGKKSGKGKREKEQKIVEKKYVILTAEEQKTREIRYAMRLIDLRACLNHIEEAFAAREELKEKENKAEKWETYLRCDGLPKPHIPPEVRLFFAKLRHFENLSIEKTIDWLLSVNERTVLSQDIFRKDMTRKTLANEIRPNFGNEYKINVNYLLKVAKSLDYYIDDETKTAKAETSILMDIIEQKKAVYNEIARFLDHYTYRILSSEDSYMETVNATTADYFYECENFRIQIWTLKNVPILFRFLEIPCIEANFHKLQLKVRLPFSILKENLTLRGLHLFFDPFSENAKSYRQDIKPVDAAELTAGMPDLHECLIYEHFMQTDLQSEVRRKLIEKRADYENKAASLAEQLENLRKSKANDSDKKKTPKLIKLPKEPMVITADMYPDVWEDFLQLDQERYRNFINLVYHPERLNLEPDEINLKKYALLGGIYQLYFVKKPVHYNFNDFTMTWHENNAELEIVKDVTAEEPQVSTSFIGTSRIMNNIRTSALAPAERILTKQDLSENQALLEINEYYDAALFVISIDLPEYLCLWGEPLPCHFEEDILGYIDETQTQTKPEPEPDKIKVSENAPTDIVMERIPSTASGIASVNVALAAGGSNISIRTKRSQSNIFRSSLASIAALQSLQQQNGHQQQLNIANVEDFVLDLPLSNVQIRNMVRHCLPLIMSSFKFPIELEDEANEEQRGKPKGKGGILLRKRSNDDMEMGVSNTKKYQFDSQKNPERVFPIFPKPDKLNMEYIIRDKDMGNTTAVDEIAQPKTFSELVQILDRIKGTYNKHYKLTFQVPKLNIKSNDLTTIGMKLSKSVPKALELQTPKLSARLSHSSGSLPKYKGIKRKASEHVGRERMGNETAQESRKQITVIEEAMPFASDEIKSVVEEEQQEIKEAVEIVVEEDKRKTFRYSHWTTKYIKRMDYQSENRKLTIWTDRLGTIGLAFKLYEHFPFKYWTIEPDLENEGQVIFTLETQFVQCVLHISAKGYQGYVTEEKKGFVRNRKIYLDIKEPITDLKELKKVFRDNFLNIFSNPDANFYIENGYFSEKHLACELHIYSCISLHCLMLKFVRSDWNRLAQRRDIVFKFGHYSEPPENMMQVRITPENATFVDIKELCSDNLDEIILEYALTWRNIDNYTDLHHLVMSTYLTAMDNRCKDAKLLVNVKNLLCEIRPLSYS